jgi:hypothetical protein
MKPLIRATIAYQFTAELTTGLFVCSFKISKVKHLAEYLAPGQNSLYECYFFFPFYIEYRW